MTIVLSSFLTTVILQQGRFFRLSFLSWVTDINLIIFAIHLFGGKKVILVALDAISSILSYDNNDAGLPWAQLVDEAGGLDRLEQLQEHENRSVKGFLFHVSLSKRRKNL